MSEKRFTLKEYDDYNYVAFDKDKPLIHLKLESFGTYAAFHRLIDRLNEQEQEIYELKKQNEKLIREGYAMIKELELYRNNEL